MVIFALPVFLVADWRLGAWAIAAGLWAAYLAIGELLSRIPAGGENLAATGLVAFLRMGRAAGLLGILIAVAVSSKSLGLPAAAVYGLAFTVELALSLLAYFGTETQA